MVVDLTLFVIPFSVCFRHLWLWSAVRAGCRCHSLTQSLSVTQSSVSVPVLCAVHVLPTRHYGDYPLGTTIASSVVGASTTTHNIDSVSQSIMIDRLCHWLIQFNFKSLIHSVSHCQSLSQWVTVSVSVSHSVIHRMNHLINDSVIHWVSDWQCGGVRVQLWVSVTVSVTQTHTHSNTARLLFLSLNESMIELIIDLCCGIRNN